MLSVFNMPKDGLYPAIKSKVNLQMPSFRRWGRSRGTLARLGIAQCTPFLLGLKTGSTPLCHCLLWLGAGSWEMELGIEGGLTFITEGSFPGPPLETLNNAVLH